MATIGVRVDGTRVPKHPDHDAVTTAAARNVSPNVIHSGQFMISDPHRSDQESSDEEEPTNAIDTVDQLAAEPVVAMGVSHNSVRQITRRGDVQFTSCVVDQSLNRLFQCLSLAYKDRAMTNPKWDTFKGLKWSMKDKIRLNNIIWREYHMQFVRKKPAVVVQFSFPLLDEVHTKAEACVLEGTYWRRRYETVEHQYRQWRLFYKHRLQQVSAQFGESDAMRLAFAVDAETARLIDDAEHAQLLEAVGMQHDAALRFATQPKCASPPPGARGGILDDPSMDFELLLSLVNQPISNPDLYQPTLFPFQPNMPHAPMIIDSMDTELDCFGDLLFGNNMQNPFFAASHTGAGPSHHAVSTTFAHTPVAAQPTFASAGASTIDTDYELFNAPMMADLNGEAETAANTTVAPQPPILTSIFSPTHVAPSPGIVPGDPRQILASPAQISGGLQLTQPAARLPHNPMQMQPPALPQSATAFALHKPTLNNTSVQAMAMPIDLPSSSQSFVSTHQNSRSNALPAQSNTQHEVRPALSQPFQKRNAVDRSPGSLAAHGAHREQPSEASLFEPISPQSFTDGAANTYPETLDSLQPLRSRASLEPHDTAHFRRQNERSVSMPTYRNSSLLAALLQNKNDVLLATRSAQPANNLQTSGNPSPPGPAQKGATKQRNLRDPPPQNDFKPSTNTSPLSHTYSTPFPHPASEPQVGPPFAPQPQTLRTASVTQFSPSPHSASVFSPPPKELQPPFAQSVVSPPSVLAAKPNDYNIGMPHSDRTPASFDFQSLAATAQQRLSTQKSANSLASNSSSFMRTLTPANDSSAPTAVRTPAFTTSQDRAATTGYPSGPQQSLLGAGPFQQSAAVTNNSRPFLQQTSIRMQSPADAFDRSIAQRQPATDYDGSTARGGLKTVLSDTCLRDMDTSGSQQTQTAHRELSLDAASSLALQNQLQMQRLHNETTANISQLAQLSHTHTLSPANSLPLAQFITPGAGGSEVTGRAAIQNAASSTDAGFVTPSNSVPSSFHNEASLSIRAKVESASLRPITSSAARSSSATRHKAPFLEQLLVSSDSGSVNLRDMLATPSEHQSGSREAQSSLPIPSHPRIGANVPSQQYSAASARPSASGVDNRALESRTTANRSGTAAAPSDRDTKLNFTMLSSGDTAGSQMANATSQSRSKAANRDRKTPSGVLPAATGGLTFAFAPPASYSDSVASTSDQKRATHISAEAKRRSHLRNSLHVLQQLIPTFNSSTAGGSPSSPESSTGQNPVKVSKAVLLQEAARYIARLRAEMRQDEETIAREKEAIERINADIDAYQRQLPVTGVDLNSDVAAAARADRAVDGTVELWNAYKESRIDAHGWKFYVFTLIFEPFFERYAQTTRGATEHEFEKCVHGWLDQFCGIHAIRQQATSAVRFVCSKTSIATSSGPLSAVQTSSSAPRSSVFGRRTDLHRS